MINEFGAECLVCGVVKTWDEFGQGVYIGHGALCCEDCSGVDYKDEDKANHAVELQCSNCGKIKPWASFEEKRGGYSGMCQSCEAKRNKERVAEHRANKKRLKSIITL